VAGATSYRESANRREIIESFEENGSLLMATTRKHPIVSILDILLEHAHGEHSNYRRFVRIMWLTRTSRSRTLFPDVTLVHAVPLLHIHPFDILDG
jgi:hypothetical protein